MFRDDIPAAPPPTRRHVLQARILRHDALEYVVVQRESYPRPMATFRLIGPHAAARAGGYPLERHFDIAALASLHGGLVELAEPCIDRNVDPLDLARPLGDCLARYLIDGGYGDVISACAVRLTEGAGVYLGSLESAAPEGLRVLPREPLPMERLFAARPLQAPPLLRAQLLLGAWICGEPATPAGLGSAEIPLLLPLSRLRVPEARRFLARAA